MGKRTGFKWNANKQRLELYVSGTAVDYFDAGNSTTYYVNNVSGASGNDGLSWGTAMDQVSTAITAVTALHTAEAAVSSTNQNLRHRIIVQGTGTTYTNLAALPNYCDVIGLGATSYGDGAGIVCIGLAGCDGIAGTARGLYLYNLQFQAPTTFYCADFVSLFRSEIDSCTFQSRVTDAAAGIRFSAASSGNYIHDCMWTAGGGAAWAVRGIDIEGTSFNNNLIEGNHIVATECGIYVVSTCVDAGGTIVRNNTMGGEVLALGVDDDATNGTIVYSGNFICCPAGAGGTLVNDGTRRWVCNYSAATFSAVTAS